MTTAAINQTSANMSNLRSKTTCFSLRLQKYGRMSRIATELDVICHSGKSLQLTVPPDGGINRFVNIGVFLLDILKML